MKSLIICEGASDWALLQYYMRKANNWTDLKKGTFNPCSDKTRDFEKNGNILTIISSKGCSRLLEALQAVIEYNINEPDVNKKYVKIAIITDNDDGNVLTDFIDDLKNKLKKPSVTINNNQWFTHTITDFADRNIIIEILPLVIPFDENGAMETFLLSAIADKDEYDKEIINKTYSFVDTIDPENRYNQRRGYKEKAKYEVFFSIRTAAEEWTQRGSILRDIPWEKYTLIQTSFKELSKL